MTPEEAYFDSTPTDTKTFNSGGTDVICTTCESALDAFTTVSIVHVHEYDK